MWPSGFWAKMDYITVDGDGRKFNIALKLGGIFAKDNDSLYCMKSSTI